MSDRTALTLTRFLDAPRDRVFRAWTDPAHLQKWWGPEAFCNPRCEWDMRPGGEIRVDMRMFDGTVYPMGGRVLEVAPPERFVFVSFPLDGEGKPLFESRNELTLSEEGGKTRMQLRIEVSGIRPEHARYLEGMEMGWSQSLLRLSALVGEELSDCELVGLRWYAAEPAQVAAAWLAPERLARWWGPKGFTNRFEECELRTGGAWTFTMIAPDGKEYSNTSHFGEVGPERFVVEHPVGPTFRLTLTVMPEGKGTRLVWRQRFESAEMRQTIGKFALVANEENLDRLGAEIGVGIVELEHAVQR